MTHELNTVVKRHLVKGDVVLGYAFSHISEFGKERLTMISFGNSLSDAKRYLKHYNGLSGTKKMKPYKRYQIAVSIVREVLTDKGNT